MSNRLFGPFRGIVTDNDDPSDLMRIRVNVPGIPSGSNQWALPCVPPGFKSVPDVGTDVWIEFEGGDPSYPIWIGTMGNTGPVVTK